MAAKALEIHPAAFSELKSALGWCLGRNETAAFQFVAEVERAVGLIV
jgi:hypothetical protein